ncbi:MAG: dienelactone hydrolase family protein [Deltaproteobacteria bacterium]|nr:dienelactone hydrolase family protein [Deltaproteobacteria bacterium]
MKQLLSFIMAITCLVATAEARLQTQVVEYRHGGVVLEGYLAYDDAFKGKRPGVLVVHEWWGINNFIRERTENLARLGYVAFAADIYGKGIRTADFQEAAAISGKYKKEPELLRDRAKAGLAKLKSLKQTDGKRLAAIGYCFGGTTVLELARSGSEVRGVVSFHGGLATEDPADAKNMKASVLVLHGADDPYVPPEEVRKFQDEMSQAGVDWQMIFYGGAVHSFTNPDAGSDKTKGAAYQERADRRSWQAMRDFLYTLLNQPSQKKTR